MKWVHYSFNQIYLSCIARRGAPLVSSVVVLLVWLFLFYTT